MMLVVGCICLPFADLVVSVTYPWAELSRIFTGAITPSYPDISELFSAVMLTVQFAVLGVMLSLVVGFVCALFYRWPVVRWACAFIRAIHELFWGLLLIAMIGVSPLAGLLAIAIPYSGVFAKVFYEMLLQADPEPRQVLRGKVGKVSNFLFSQLMQVVSQMSHYVSYRLECALRSSAVLGFVGLPTIGFHLESAIKEGHYSEAWMLLYVLLLLIAGKRWWFNGKTWWVMVLSAVIFFPFGQGVSLQYAGAFIADEIVPAPMRGQVWASIADGKLLSWFLHLWSEEVYPGIVDTIVLTMVSVVLTGLFVVFFLPLQSFLFLGRYGRGGGIAVLLVVRSLPEVVIAFVLMLLIGPSMIPAIIALALHNGGVICYLLRGQVDSLDLRPDCPAPLLLYSYEVLPRVSAQLMSFWLYRWEVIMRETAILGLLGVSTLGFYIDSAFEDIRYDRALLLILFAAALNMVMEAISGQLQRRLRLSSLHNN
ncbi:hypothetical protein A9Q99_21445 [Gammaproteobacteria bacterium 45_16_T64]|nr:hypothetical protein A9Q99_21445 [Gammaproteobacteria bacterium 45_16_T64]